MSNEAETTVTGSFAATIPAAIRSQVDLEPGDRLRWDVDHDGRLVVEIVRERYGVAEELEPIDMGETDAVEITDGYEWS